MPEERSTFYQHAKAMLGLVNRRDELEDLINDATAKLGILEQVERFPPLAQTTPALAKLNLKELALVACLDESADASQFEAKKITDRLKRMGKSVLNITSTMEPLVKEGLLEVVQGNAVNKHKTYCITSDGRGKAERLRS